MIAIGRNLRRSGVRALSMLTIVLQPAGAQDIPVAFSKQCLGVTFSGYIFHPICLKGNPDAGNVYLEEGINRWYHDVDQLFCHRDYRSINFTPAQVAEISSHTTRIWEIDSNELQAVANCDATTIAEDTTQIDAESNAIYNILQSEYNNQVANRPNKTADFANNLFTAMAFLQNTGIPETSAVDAAENALKDLMSSTIQNQVAPDFPSPTLNTIYSILHNPALMQNCNSATCGAQSIPGK